MIKWAYEPALRRRRLRRERLEKVVPKVTATLDNEPLTYIKTTVSVIIVTHALLPSCYTEASVGGTDQCVQKSMADDAPMADVSIEPIEPVAAVEGDAASVPAAAAPQTTTLAVTGWKTLTEMPVDRAVPAGIGLAIDPVLRANVALLERFCDPNDPHIASALNQVVNNLLVLERFAEAEPLKRRALQINETALGAGHAIVIHDVFVLAKILEVRRGGGWRVSPDVICRPRVHTRVAGALTVPSLFPRRAKARPKRSTSCARG